MDTSDPGITDVASYLAARIPTGADSLETAREDWRTTLYNARDTNALRPLRDLVLRSVPDDPTARELCDALVGRKRPTCG